MVQTPCMHNNAQQLQQAGLTLCACKLLLLNTPQLSARLLANSTVKCW